MALWMLISVILSKYAVSWIPFITLMTFCVSGTDHDKFLLQGYELLHQMEPYIHQVIILLDSVHASLLFLFSNKLSFHGI